MSQGDVYSSEGYTSSDDHSSINSVIHVEIVPTHGSESDSLAEVLSGAEYNDGGSPAPAVPERPPMYSLPPLPPQHTSSTTEEEETTSDSEDDSLVRRGGDADSSSTSSEETQVWVPSTCKSPPGIGLTPKSAMRNSGLAAQHSPMMGPMRNSIVSQSGSSGRAETSLAAEEGHGLNGGDSGISNESPETHSSGEHHLHPFPATHRASPHAHFTSTPPIIHSPPRSPVVPHGHYGGKDPESQQMSQAQMEHHCRESLFNLLSALYALLLVVIGAVLPVAEVFADPVSSGGFEGFYIFLYGVSVAFLLYVYAFLLRARTTTHLCPKKNSKGPDTSLLQRVTHRAATHGHSHTGSFYLRLGAVGFGIGALIHEGLMFGELFEAEFTSPCRNMLRAVQPIIHLAFTFIQLYFIFLNSKMCIHRYRVFARFGLMHMMATNICVWLRTMITETIRDVHVHVRSTDNTIHGLDLLSYALGYPNNTVISSTTTSTTTTAPQAHQYVVNGELMNQTDNLTLTLVDQTPPLDCSRRHEIMSNVVEAASPYLYPCVIQYSLIATGILFIMWRNIGLPHRKHRTHDSNAERSKRRVDCSGANRGLFFGIFMLVGTIISMIVFFVLVEKPQYVRSAVMVVHFNEIGIYCLTMIAIIVAGYKMRDMRFHKDKDNMLDEVLHAIALIGQYIFCVFCVVAGRYNTNTYGGSLVMATSLLLMLQATFQTVFILQALRRSAARQFHETKKPGREYITFLLVSNMALWGINTFQVLRTDSNPVTLKFYSILPWSIVTHVSTPMAIFYRFHSTVCLANIWKNAYKSHKLH